MGFRTSHQKFLNKEPLTRRQAMEANCYACNGETAEKRDDCKGGETCPLYQWSPWARSLVPGIVAPPRRVCKSKGKRVSGE
jgi:hypothetical protein